jgi:exodeoxyribonuclease VII small subunit
MTDTSIHHPNYEENLARLQHVVERLERDALGLEESLSLFEEGMSLANHCDEQLRRVEERVKVLVSGTETPTPRADLPIEPVTIAESREQSDD